MLANNQLVFSVLQKSKMSVGSRRIGECVDFRLSKVWNFSSMRERIVIFFNNFVGKERSLHSDGLLNF